MENTNFKVYIEKTTEDYGCLYVEPLERGYGDTLGNALRRLLLSSIRGVAVTAVRIDGVLHEFSTIPGVREDVIEILMNLKHIPIKAKTEKPQLKPEGYKLVTLDSDDLPKSFFTREENPGVITAKDLPWDNDFEFCGDGVLCTLEPGAHLVMEIYIEPGVGYLSAERERQAHLPVDALLTDAIFSPVKRVNYRIEPARVGQSIDYERLVLEVWTNGAILPEDAVREAAGIAKNCFGHIAGNVNSVPVDDSKEKTSGTEVVKDTQKQEKQDETEAKQLPFADESIHALELSLRSENCLLRVGIETVGDLLQRSHEDLLKIRNLGKKSLTEIEKKLEDRNLTLSALSMYPEDEVIPETNNIPDTDTDEYDDDGEAESDNKAVKDEDKPKEKGKKDKTKSKTPKTPAKNSEVKDQAAPVEEEKETKPKKSSSSKSKKKAEDAKPEAEETKKSKKSVKKAPAAAGENNDNQ